MIIGGTAPLLGAVKRNDIVWSGDGTKWNIVPDETSGFLRKAGTHNTVVFQDRIYVIGGYEGEYGSTNAVWYCR